MSAKDRRGHKFTSQVVTQKLELVLVTIIEIAEKRGTYQGGTAGVHQEASRLNERNKESLIPIPEPRIHIQL